MTAKTQAKFNNRTTKVSIDGTHPKGRKMRNKELAGASCDRVSDCGQQNALLALGGKRRVFVQLIALKRAHRQKFGG
jgi:hypothetical protein